MVNLSQKDGYKIINILLVKLLKDRNLACLKELASFNLELIEFESREQIA